MKRIVSYLLAVVLIFTLCPEIYAANVEDYAAESTDDAGNGAISAHTQQDAVIQDTADAEEKREGNDEGKRDPAGGTEEAGSTGSAGTGSSESADGTKAQTTEGAEGAEGARGIQSLSNEDGQPAEVKADAGQVDVTIQSALVLKKDVDFTVSLAGAGTGSKTVKLGASDKGLTETEATFTGLTSGDYTLTVTAPGFKKYRQDIHVDGWAYDVNLVTGFAELAEGHAYKEGSAHPGVLLIGDVDGDGDIDGKDKDALVDAIDAASIREGEKGGQAQGVFDLNGDDKTDIVDLEYFAKGYETDKHTAATVVKNVPESAVDVKAGDGTADGGTLVDGELSDLLKDEGEPVTLSRKDGNPISAANPVSVTFDVQENGGREVDGIVIDAAKGEQIKDAHIEITYLDENGQEQQVGRKIDVPVAEGIDFLLESDVKVTRSGDGSIHIDLGSQIAVKKVTLTIKGMKNNNNLAEISRVEFVNGMENRIPEPEMNVPENLKIKAGNKMFSVSWDMCANVTGYEVKISGEGKNGKTEEVRSVRGTTLEVSSINGDKLVNNKEYDVAVQSVNGTWRSGYSASVKAVPKVDKKPDAPDYLKTTGQYRSVKASWKKMEDTDYFNLYYKKSSESSYKKIGNITASSYTIMDLQDETSYDVYVTGVNDLGESGKSLVSTAKTTNPDPAKMPKYKMINYAGEGEVSEHIIAAAGGGTMQDSPKDTQAGTAFGTVDNNFASHYLLNSWDSGGYNNLGKDGGLTYEFDKAYKLEKFALQEVLPQGNHYFYAKVRYWDEQGKEVYLGNVTLQRKTDDKNRIYYLISLPEPVTAKKIQFGLARYSASGTITVSEVYFYHYDSLEDDIDALYKDDVHIELKEDVTQETIDELRKRINTKDEVSGEYHPDKAKLEKELAAAEELLKANTMEVVRIHNSITTNDYNRGFGGLNAWQPLGVTAAAGEDLTVYVGSNRLSTGQGTSLQLVVTQYHAEASSMSKVVATLKVGKNDITIPSLSSTKAEAGGALYIQYTGNDANDEYAVRVSGGAKVPVLDLYQTADSGEKLERAKEYLTELEAYTQKMSEEHEKLHKASGNSSVAYDYDEKNCILGASDILLDNMLLSLPAKQIYAGTGSGGIDAKAQKLVTSMDAMEEMLHLFYQHKGLNDSAKDQIDRFPSGHLNIRYQRMFAGAFMYASGNHIGIEWAQTAGMVNCASVKSDENGRYVSGNYFGWGIAHEIGHCINQGGYAIAEITNNYFSVLAQAKDRNDSVRFSYDEVYKKVTSGAKGRASNVFTQLGLYWQLHLAYDDGYNYKTYENYDDQLKNLFFARVDTYARTPSKAPHGLTLSGGQDQVLMRLSCAAAEKNLLEFFERWGMTPDDTTKAYAKQFDKETRAIFYASDDARVYRLEKKNSSLKSDGTTEAVGDASKAAVNENTANQVDFTLSSKNIPESDVLGYEIVRYTISGGKQESEIAGFATAENADSFHDHVTTMNNRVVTYGITVVDKFLNRSKEKMLAPIKIEHKGNISKEGFTVSSENIDAEMISPSAPESPEDHEYDPCEPKPESSVKYVIDNDGSTAFTGTAKAGAEVVLEFNRTHTVTGLQYTVNAGNPVKDYAVCIRQDGEWKEVASGTFGSGKVQEVYFANKDGGSVATYSISAVKLAVKSPIGSKISISELDVLGVTGDNVDFRRSGEGTAAIGRLGADYHYGNKPENVIPEDSIIFTGSYKGNPAYNTVILYDQDGNIVGGTDAEGNLNASQIILADVPEKGNLMDVRDGTWIYWIKPGDSADLGSLKKVRAELYRVNDAKTNEGQRMVSDSLFEDMPETLPEITLGSNRNE